MAKIIPFPSDGWEEKSKELLLGLSNKAIYDDTYQLLLDAQEIEIRIHNMYLNDNTETRTLLLIGFCLFADGLMKVGLTSESLTDILFERFEFRNVRIDLFDGETVEGEVVATTYGYEPNAYYTVSVNGRERKVFRKT